MFHQSFYGYLFLNYKKISKSLHEKSNEYPMLYKIELQTLIKISFDFPEDITFLIKVENLEECSITFLNLGYK